jgi:hypothetical protein
MDGIVGKPGRIVRIAPRGDRERERPRRRPADRPRGRWRPSPLRCSSGISEREGRHQSGSTSGVKWDLGRGRI